MTKTRFLVASGILLALFAAWIATLIVASAVVKVRVPVSLPPTAYVYSLGDGFVSARGTWIIEGEKQGFPLQTSEIRCERDIRRCTAATAEVGYGDQMHADLDFYEVAEGGESRIVFVDDSPACVRYIYTIDLLTQSANGVRMKLDKPRIATADCERLEKQLRLTLKGGFEVWNELQTDAMPWFGRIAVAPLRMFQ